MKVALLSGASSIHTIRWANGLAKAGIDVYLISQHPLLEPVDSKVNTYILPYRGVAGYFTMVPKVKRILKKIRPDIVNAHYASGYATTASLVNYHPWILSVWGSDIYYFPQRSPLHKMLVRTNLLSADRVASTSYAMADQTKVLTPELQNISITPFGVDINYYDSLTTPLSKKDDSISLTIGTVKSLSKTYGIDILIQSFSLLLKKLKKSHPELIPKIQFRIVGSGAQENELKNLTRSLGLDHIVKFVGRVENNDVPYELDKLDIYVALSRSESFGVAIIEASAAGRPVIVSDVGGLPEVVINGETGLIVPKEDPVKAAEAMYKLVLDRELRIKLGETGKKHVYSKYDWDKCVEIMVNLYKDTISDYK